MGTSGQIAQQNNSNNAMYNANIPRKSEPDSWINVGCETDRKKWRKNNKNNIKSVDA